MGMAESQRSTGPATSSVRVVNGSMTLTSTRTAGTPCAAASPTPTGAVATPWPSPRHDPAPDNFHELRKRAKYSWYHVRLLEPSAPSILGPLGKQFKHLADGLGDAHDLAVLSAQLERDPDAFGGDAGVRDALDLLDHHREQLEHDAVSLAVQLYAEPSKRYARRLERYWDKWQRGMIDS